MSGRVTIKDVAKAAGVSVATASDALNNKGRVSSATRKKVGEVAAALGYSPSLAARSLISGRSGVIAMAISSAARNKSSTAKQMELDIEYFLGVLSGAAAAAGQKGFLVAMVPLQGNLQDLLYSADGLIVVDPVDSDPLIADEVLSRIGHCVTVGSNTKGLSWVDNDFYAATTRALEHLISEKKSQVAFFLSETQSPYVRDELAAYVDWCGEQGQAPVILRSASSNIGDAEATVREYLMDSTRTFDAVLTSLETLAIAVERSAFALNISVPGELQILSLTDSRFLEAGLPTTITALDLQPEELGAQAVYLLAEQIAGEKQTKTRISESFLRVRESTLRA